MHSRDFHAILLSLALAVLLLITVPNGAAVHGPREDDLEIRFYATQEKAYGALTTGEIDLVLYDLTWAQADNAFINPNLVTCKVPDSSFYEFDLNNNYSIPRYPGVRSPMNYTEMRQAIAFLSDKDYYVGTLYNNQAVRIDQMIAAPYYGWANASMSYPHYPYEYSPAGAKAVLDSKFPVGTTPNPYHDVSDPLSSPFLRQYPTDHPQKAGQDLDPLIFYVRTEFTPRLHSGIRIEEALRRMGVPLKSTWGPSSVTYTPVMGEFNYHFYTGGWSVSRFPPVTLHGLYHSNNAYPYGNNYVTGIRPGFPTHPKLDELLHRAASAISYTEAVKYNGLAVGYMTEICVNVPLWSPASYWAWTKNLLGVVNMQGKSPENDYTFMNAYKVDGSPIRCGTVGYATSLNIVFSNWVYEYSILDRMNLYGGVDWPAYNVAADQAGFVDAFDTTTWNDSGTLKTKVVMSLRENGYTAKPVSGDQGEHINASHYFWNAWLDYQMDEWFCGFCGDFTPLHHIEITGSYDFEIYYDTLSYWNTYQNQGPLRPMDLWMAQGDAFIAEYTQMVPAPSMPGAIPLTYAPIWIASVTAGGTPLTFLIDYNIILGELYILTPQTGDVVATYWYVPDDALRGFFPGNLPWQTILEGAGQYYITSYTSSVSATFKRNPFYYMVTPLLGDIDFVKKPDGHYKVDIFDLALAAGAYGSQGTAVPSANWFPGADLAPNGGVIDIFDLVTVTGTNWDKEYDPLEP